MTASRTPSEIWSAILSGWPSVTDSEVNRYSLSLKEKLRVSCRPASDRPKSVATRSLPPAALLALHEVDHQRDALEGVALTQPVFHEVGVVARQPHPVVDVDGEARRPGLDLRDVHQLEAAALLLRRLAGG